MMRIYWTAAAAADLQHISDYLKERHPHYRQPTLRKLYDTVRSLRQSPYRRRPESEPDTREVVFPLARRRRDLDALDQHVCRVGRQRFEVVRIGRKYGPPGFRECHDKCIDGRPTTGQSPQ